MMQRKVLWGIFALLALAIVILYDAAVMLANHLDGTSSSSSSSSSTSPVLSPSDDISSHRPGGRNSIIIINGHNNNNNEKKKHNKNAAVIRGAQVKELNSVAKMIMVTTKATESATAMKKAQQQKQPPPYHDTDNNESPDDFLRRRSLDGRILLIPVNSGYLDFGLNLLCSLKSSASKLLLSSSSSSSPADQGDNIGFVFVAMDADVDAALRKMNLPVFRDPDMPVVSSKSAAWADPKFHKLVCTKLFPVLRAMRIGLSVILSDADIVFRRDPTPYLDARRKVRQQNNSGNQSARAPSSSSSSSSSRIDSRVNVMFSIGSCHRDLPDNYDLSSGDGIAKLNTGFYAVSLSSSPSEDSMVLDLFERALARCTNSGKVHELEGDQPAMNAELNKQPSFSSLKENVESNPHRRRTRYGFFDGCLFANGCVFFKHLCANLTSLDPASDKAIALLQRGGKLPNVKLGSVEASNELRFRRDDPVMVHANFIVGKEDKIKHLRKAHLWDEKCISTLKAKK